MDKLNFNGHVYETKRLVALATQCPCIELEELAVTDQGTPFDEKLDLDLVALLEGKYQTLVLGRTLGKSKGVRLMTKHVLKKANNAARGFTSANFRIDEAPFQPRWQPRDHERSNFGRAAREELPRNNVDLRNPRGPRGGPMR